MSLSPITLKMDGFIFANSTDSDETLRSTVFLRTWKPKMGIQFLALIPPLIFVLKILLLFTSAACIQMHVLLIVDRNTVNPDQAAPNGSILFAIYVSYVYKQIREQLATFANSGKRVKCAFGKASI